MKLCQAALLTAFAAIHLTGYSQSLASSAAPPVIPDHPTAQNAAPAYNRPSSSLRLHNYLSDAFGPYPAAMSLFTAALQQGTDTPPDWHQGFRGLSKRFGSDFAISSANNTTRYALAEALKEDTLYYRCTSKGPWKRLRHAALSTLIARRGEDGHSVFSTPALAAPYASTMTAVYAWYPSRYSAKDAFRMGNFSLLWAMTTNISIEFIPSKAHSVMDRFHLSSRRTGDTSEVEHE